MLHMFCPSALIEMASPAVKSGLSKLETCDFSAQQDSAALVDISRHSRLGLETRYFWPQDGAPLADMSRYCRLGLETRNFWQQDSALLVDIFLPNPSDEIIPAHFISKGSGSGIFGLRVRR